MSRSKAKRISSPKRRAEAGQGELFALTSELFYKHQASLDDLVRDLDLSASTIKRLLRQLRHQRVLHGRLGAFRLNLAPLTQVHDAYCAGVVATDPDIRCLKSLPGSRRKHAYRTEEEMLGWLLRTLPRSPSHLGRVIVESAHILMGAPGFGILLMVYALSTEALFSFARFGVERAEGVDRTHTMMIAHSVVPEGAWGALAARTS